MIIGRDSDKKPFVLGSSAKWRLNGRGRQHHHDKDFVWFRDGATNPKPNPEDIYFGSPEAARFLGYLDEEIEPT